MPSQGEAELSETCIIVLDRVSGWMLVSMRSLTLSNLPESLGLLDDLMLCYPICIARPCSRTWEVVVNSAN